MHYYPDVSLTAQRRIIGSVSTCLIFVSTIIFILVISKKLTIRPPRELGFVERAVWNLAPIMDTMLSPEINVLDEGESMFTSDLERKLKNWVMDNEHSTRHWNIMVPQSRRANYSNRRSSRGRSMHVRKLMMSDVPKLHQRDSPEYRELKKELAELSTDSGWPKHVIYDYNEVYNYFHYFHCEHVALLSINMFNASSAERDLLDQSFAWEQDCVINIFPMMRSRSENESLQHKYEGLIRLMYLIVSRSIATSSEEPPWIFLLNHLTALTNRQVSLSDIISRISGATSRKNPRNFNAENILSIESQVDMRDPINDKTRDTIEKVACGETRYRRVNNLSCADRSTTPAMHQLAYIAGTRALCQFKFGPHLATDVQLFRPSPLAALIGTSMRQYFRLKLQQSNESLAMARLMAALIGFRPADIVTLCRARDDDGKNAKRWHEACDSLNRFVFSRFVETRRFSGHGQAENMFSFGEHQLLSGEALFVHEEDDNVEVNSAALEAIQSVAPFWLQSLSQGAFRFFDGEVASSDWALDGPSAVAWGCGAWLAGSGCSHMANDYENWRCGDFALSFAVCGGDKFYSSEFRQRIINDSTCSHILPKNLSDWSTVLL